jgi:Cytochrome P450
MEIMRHGNTAPIGVAHRAMKTSRLGSYVIPQDSIILVNLWSIMRDQEHWGDPDVFRPERFIHPTSGEVLYDETLIPFGLGKKTLDKKTILRKTGFLLYSPPLFDFGTIRPPLIRCVQT